MSSLILNLNVNAFKTFKRSAVEIIKFHSYFLFAILQRMSFRFNNKSRFASETTTTKKTATIKNAANRLK